MELDRVMPNDERKTNGDDATDEALNRILRALAASLILIGIAGAVLFLSLGSVASAALIFAFCLVGAVAAPLAIRRFV